MPKETITTKNSERRSREGKQEPVIQICWNNEWAQIATVLPALIEGSPEITEATVDQGWFINLDRQSINRMIRTLRRARDTAFGADA